MQLTQDDSGRSYQLRVGERVTLTLPESPTTGYEWDPQVDRDMLRQVESHFVGATSPRGAAGDRVITFEVLRAGRTDLHCNRRRAWESDAAEQFQVHLDISSD